MEEIKEVTKKCSSCDKDVSIKAKRCPYCRQDLRGWFRRHPILTFLLIIFFAPFVLINMINGASKSNSSNGAPEPIKPEHMNASVNFKDNQFIITNLEKSDCQNARMQVNSDYELKGYMLASGQVYTVGAGQFTKGDGTRFNPFSTKPQNFYIGCRGSNELSSAYWYGEF